MNNPVCKRCWCKKIWKNGMMSWLQRYKCQDCWYNYTDTAKRWVSMEIKKKALIYYLEWLWLRSIGRLLWYSYVSVYYWIKELWQLAEDIHQHEKQQPKKVAVMELDEMWHYCKKNEEKLGYGLLSIEKTWELLILK